MRRIVIVKRISVAVFASGLLFASCGSPESRDSKPAVDSQTSVSSPTSQARTKNSANVPFDGKLETDAATGAPDLVFVGFGDSYASGEGNPAVASPDQDPAKTVWWNLSENSPVTPGVVRVGTGPADTVVDDQSTDQSRMCHRSSKAAFVQGVMEVQRLNPGRNIYWKFFACTGAQMQFLFDKNYNPRGTVMLGAPGTDLALPQAEQARRWLNSLPWPAGASKRIDGLYISIGGNDAGGYEHPMWGDKGLGALIAQCISPISEAEVLWDGCEGSNYVDGVGAYVSDTSPGRYSADTPQGGGLRGKYRYLNQRMQEWSSTNGIDIGKVFLGQYPDLLHSSAIDPATGEPAICGEGGEVWNDPVGSMTKRWVSNADPEDWQYVADRVTGAIRDAQVDITAELGWELVTYANAADEADRRSFFDYSTTHGICAAEPWIHINETAELQQGIDMSTPLQDTSFGAFHPNAAGWRQIAQRVAYHLDKFAKAELVRKSSPSTTASIAPGATTLPPRVDANSSDGGFRPDLPAAAMPDSNAVVTADLARDPSGILQVEAARWQDDAGPRELVWQVDAGASRSIDCINCAFLNNGTKRIIAAVLAESFGKDVQSVHGYEPSAIDRDLRASGWAAEFIVGSEPAGLLAGDAIRNWILSCSGDSCRNTSLGVSYLKWDNKIFSVRSCSLALKRGYEGVANQNVVRSSARSFEQREFAFDRVVLGSPDYYPYYQLVGDDLVVDHYETTGCAR